MFFNISKFFKKNKNKKNIFLSDITFTVTKKKIDFFKKSILGFIISKKTKIKKCQSEICAKNSKLRNQPNGKIALMEL
jgi:hypothetical protein